MLKRLQNRHKIMSTCSLKWIGIKTEIQRMKTPIRTWYGGARKLNMKYQHTWEENSATYMKIQKLKQPHQTIENLRKSLFTKTWYELTLMYLTTWLQVCCYNIRVIHLDIFLSGRFVLLPSTSTYICL